MLVRIPSFDEISLVARYADKPTLRYKNYKAAKFRI